MRVINGIEYFGINNTGSTQEYVFKRINVGDWDMDSTTSIVLPHGLSATEYKTIISLSGIIINDADNELYQIMYEFTSPSTVEYDAEINFYDSTNFYLVRLTGGSFDTTSFNATSFNRGWITFMYKPD